MSSVWTASVDVPSEGMSRKDKDEVQDGLRAAMTFCAKVDELAKSTGLVITFSVSERLLGVRVGNLNSSDDRDDDRDMGKHERT
jgi:hypothetical protein